jgi:hypothetical protein
MRGAVRMRRARQRAGERELVASLAGNGVNISLYRDSASGHYRVLAYGPPFGSPLPDGRRAWTAECRTAETAAATGASWARRLGVMQQDVLARVVKRDLSRGRVPEGRP